MVLRNRLSERALALQSELDGASLNALEELRLRAELGAGEDLDLDTRRWTSPWRCGRTPARRCRAAGRRWRCGRAWPSPWSRPWPEPAARPAFPPLWEPRAPRPSRARPPAPSLWARVRRLLGACPKHQARGAHAEELDQLSSRIPDIRVAIVRFPSLEATIYSTAQRPGLPAAGLQEHPLPIAIRRVDAASLLSGRKLGGSPPTML